MNLPITYIVDISRPILPVPMQPMLISGDAEANMIRLELYDGETPYSPGGSCVGMAVRQDGGTVPITGTVEGNVLSVTLPAAAYAIPGALNVIVKSVDGDVKTSLFFGCGNVLIGETGTAIDPGTVIPSVADLVQDIADAVDSIPPDYSTLSGAVEHTTGAVLPTWESGGMYSATGIEYNSNSIIRTTFIPVTPGETYRFDWTAQNPFNIYGFAANTPTSSGVNQRIAYKATPYAQQPLFYIIPANVNYIRLQINGVLTDDKPTMVNVGESILLDLSGKIIDADITADTKANYFTDADDAPVNTVYSVSSTAEMANTPLGPGVVSNADGTHYTDLRSIAGYQSGILYTYKSGVMTNQLFLSATKASGAASNPAVLWYRCKWSAGAWSDWHAAGDRVALSASNIIIAAKMIAPYKDSQGNYTATDTGNPNTEYMGGDPRLFNDFNNAPINKMYQIDLNCTSELMANNPMPGKSSVLCTFGFGYASSHGRFQLCVGLNYPNPFAFIRYGYFQSADAGFVWTPWASLTAATQTETFGIKTRLTNGTDLDTVKTSGVYLLGTNGNYGNAPSGLTYGFLTVKTINVITCQTVETPAGNFARFFDGSAWGAWAAR